MLIGAAPALLTFVIRLFVPESHLWKELASWSFNSFADVFSKPLLRRTILAIIFASVPLIVTWGIVQWIPVWADEMAGDQPDSKGRAPVMFCIGCCDGIPSRPVAWESHWASMDLFPHVRIFNRRLPMALPRLRKLWLGIQDGDNPRRILDGVLLRLAATLFAGVVSDSGSSNRARTSLHFWSGLCCCSRTLYARTDEALGRKLFKGWLGTRLRLSGWHGCDLACP